MSLRLCSLNFSELYFSVDIVLWNVLYRLCNREVKGFHYYGTCLISLKSFVQTGEIKCFFKMNIYNHQVSFRDLHVCVLMFLCFSSPPPDAEKFADQVFDATKKWTSAKTDSLHHFCCCHVAQVVLHIYYKSHINRRSITLCFNTMAPTVSGVRSTCGNISHSRWQRNTACLISYANLDQMQCNPWRFRTLCWIWRFHAKVRSFWEALFRICRWAFFFFCHHKCTLANERNCYLQTAEPWRFFFFFFCAHFLLTKVSK